jgi:formylmethanofuran dehydrogenase subunit E
MAPAELYAQVAALHDHLCPRQVLGVRIGLLAVRLLGFESPPAGKRLFAIVETDGCACDGVSVATGCWVGKRSLRVEDYGKVAASLADRTTGRAVRVWPRADARAAALALAGAGAAATGGDGVEEGRDERWRAMLAGYQALPDEALLCHTPVRLGLDLAWQLGAEDMRAACSACGEEIANGRELRHGTAVRCRACAGAAYYESLPDAPPA